MRQVDTFNNQRTQIFRFQYHHFTISLSILISTLHPRPQSNFAAEGPFLRQDSVGQGGDP